MGKFVLFNFYNFGQKVLEYYQGHYTKIGDYYGDIFTPHFIGTMVALPQILANAVNATLVGPGHSKYRDKVYPSVLPGLPLFHNERSAMISWRRFYNNSSFNTSGNPEFFLVPHLDFNLAYCAYPKRKTDSVWNFAIFTDPFDRYAWITLALLVLLVSMMLAKFKLTSLNQALFVSVAGLLQNVSGGGFQVRSKLLILWLLASLVLVTFYSGEMTGQVIRPPPEETVEDCEQLEANNYTLFYSNPPGYYIIDDTVKTLSSDGSYVSRQVKCLIRLWRTARLNDTTHEINMKRLTSDDKLATIIQWPFAMLTTTRGNVYIKNNLTKTKFRNKKCYVGKTLIPAGEAYLGIHPPGHKLLVDAMYRLVDAGIFTLWMKEFESLAYSKSIQERRRIKSPTEIEEEQVNIHALTMKGKTATIFLLCAFSLVVSLLGFVAEVVSKSEMLSVRNANKLWPPIATVQVVSY